jgi:integrase
MFQSIETAPPRKPTKPDKPYAGFPMFAHQGSGQWAKKIRKRLVYFGSWRQDPEGTAALELFNREWPHLKEGRTPPTVDVSNGCTLKMLVNDFLNSKRAKLDAGELSPRSFRDYYKTCANLVDFFRRERLVSDLRPDDFGSYRKKLAERLGVVSLKNEINRTTIVFNHAHDNRLIDQPINYGSKFDRPSAKALREDRNEAGAKLFERDEVLRLLGAADVHLKAMILLGINCGFGNTDVASLPQSALDLKTGWVEFPRPKTAIRRRCPLWPETIAALKAALAVRPAPDDPAANGLVFLTRLGRPWVRVKPNTKKNDELGPEASIPIDAVSGQFRKLLRKLKINGRRGLGFYTCRHNFETFAGESKDQVAVDAVMGHVDSSMAGNYRHRISDERLKAVVAVVRKWLFGTEGGDA